MRDTTRHNDSLSGTASDARFREGRPARAPRWHARGQGFKSPQLHHHEPAGHRPTNLFSGASRPCRIARFVPPACHSMLAAASPPGSMRPRSARPRRPRGAWTLALVRPRGRVTGKTVGKPAPLRYVGVRPIDSSPVDGLLRRPTPGEIVEGGRLGRPCGPGALSRASKKPSSRLGRHFGISIRGDCVIACG
jgi:hypothetical protein